MSAEEIVYYVDRRGALTAAVAALIVAASFLLFHLFVAPIVSQDPEVSLVQRVVSRGIGPAGFVVFAIVGIIYLRRLMSRQPYLVISKQGVFDNASGVWSGAGWIAWSEIAEIRLSRYHNLPSVELVPSDREQLMRRFGWVERLNRSRTLGYPAVAFRGPLLPAEPSVLVQQMETFWRRERDG
jgi:hypothetical protein